MLNLRLREGLKLILHIFLWIATEAEKAVKVRLSSINGFKSTGFLEIFYNGTWGTVCKHHFFIDDARVVCRQLGYTEETSFGTLYGNGTNTGPIWLDNVDCRGKESTIAACEHNGWGNNSCSHKDDIGVTCHDGKFMYSVVSIDVRIILFSPFCK